MCILGVPKLVTATNSRCPSMSGFPLSAQQCRSASPSLRGKYRCIRVLDPRSESNWGLFCVDNIRICRVAKFVKNLEDKNKGHVIIILLLLYQNVGR